MRRNSGIIGPKQNTTGTAAKGLFDTYDQYNAKKDNAWPHFQINSVTSNNGTNLNENVTSTFTVTTSGAITNIPLKFTIENVSGPALSASDFDNISESSGILYGSFTVTSSNSATFDLKPVGDGISESNVVKISIRRGGIINDPLFVTENLTIGDASVPLGTNITSSFYEISNRFINSQTYMGNSSDYNGPYDVGEVQTDFSGSGRVYIGVKITGPTTYYNDVPIAGIQIISGSTLVRSWIFNTSSGGTGSGWQTYTSQISGSSSQGFPVTPATASGYSYSNMGTSAGTGKFSYATATSSSYTGAADGIGNSYKLSGSGGSSILAPVGNAQINQTSSTYYAYRETSGSTRYSGAVMRSPTYTFSGGEYIRVIHAVTGRGGSYSLDPDDTLYVAVY